MAITIFDVNTKKERRQGVENLKRGFLDLFNRVQEAEICIVCDFPAIGSSYGKTDYLIFINIPYYKGNYYRYRNKDGNWIYLRSLVLGIKKIEDDSIEMINNDSFVSNQAEFNYKEALDEERNEFVHFAKDTIESQFNDCAIFYIVKSEKCKSCNRNDYILSDKINLKQLIETASERTRLPNSGSVNNFKYSENESLSTMVNKLIEKANEINDYGILTKKKIDKITDLSIKTTQDIIEQQGHQLTIVSGKPGSGKTLTLLRVFYKTVKNKHHARLLTYNKLLVHDLNQCIRNLPDVKSTNSSIKTLHQFFFQIGKRLGVTAIMGEDRIDELMSVCTSRVNIAIEYIKNYHANNGRWPTDRSDLEHYQIERADRQEVSRFYNYYFNQKDSNEDLETIKSSFFNKRRNQLINYAGSQAFIEDYPKALEMIYYALTKTEDFYNEYNIKDRRELLSKMTKLENKEGEVTYEEYLKDAVNRSKGLAKWSNTILIDEAQDCLRMEKAILVSLRGPEHLIVASGGKDQLIRNREETNWSVVGNIKIPYFHPREGRTTYRQKRNVVEFINTFVRYYGLASEMNSMAESNGLGRVIIDCRSISGTLPKDIVTELSLAGEAYGCSSYENIMVMLPERGYVSGTSISTLNVDENDNFDISISNVNRELQIDPCGLNVWKGFSDDKSKIKVPGHNQTRFIFYDSCRGMEAWNVLCMGIDSFFDFKRRSKDAEKYAAANSNLLSTPEQLKNKYGLLWCYMAFTRAIDTLYLKIEDVNSDFSRELLSVAEQCGDIVEILRD